MPQLLNDDIIKQIQEVFSDLKHPVHLMFFGSQHDCPYCGDTRQLVEIYDMESDSDLAARYHVDKAPGLVIAAKEGEQITDFGIRLSGIPAGHEFSSLIQGILLVSNRDSGLNPQTRAFLKGLDKPVLLQVFVTPT
jgi:alkyl hydroperoxide reductase subunit AhpF